jgi:membrane fusion protein
VPSSAVGQLRPGQRVRLMLDAFPHQQFGAAVGDVESVSEFVLLPTDIPPTFGIREATYKVRIKLRDDSIGGAGERYPLRPGMLLAAEIIVEDLRLVDWLLQPLRHMAT